MEERKKIKRKLGIIDFPSMFPYEDEMIMRKVIYESVGIINRKK
jgi:hypothetical protein